MFSLLLKDLISDFYLFSILNRPIFKSNRKWSDFAKVVESLAECFCKYRDYLVNQLAEQQKRHNMEHPVRTDGSDMSVEHRQKCSFVSHKYHLFGQAVANAELLKPVVFDESSHPEIQFEDSMQRFRFFPAIQLSVPIDLFSIAWEVVLSQLCSPLRCQMRGLKK